MRKGGFVLDSTLGLLWQPCRGGARILRVYGDSPVPVVPAALDGVPVAEIGAYCFADRRPADDPTFRFWSSDGSPREEVSHEVTGNFVRQVTLPGTVSVLNNGAFYNCRQLEELRIGRGASAALGLGSDLFTNCRQLRRFVLDAAPDAPTGLIRLVGAVSADIEAVFAPDGEPQAALFFPEYSELLDENTPAHIFNHSIEGIGYRYRQCFEGGVLRPEEYDAAFDQATVGESSSTLCRIAMDRLRYPFALRQESWDRYTAQLRAHPDEAAAPILGQRDTEALRLLCSLLDLPARRRTALACSAAGWSEGAALALEGTARRRPKTYDFDDL